MVIDRNALFESTKALWPTTIELSESPDATNKIYWANEAAYPVEENWRQVAMWAFHQAVSELEKRALNEGTSVISPSAVEFTAFDTWMRFNLDGDDGWLDEKAEWEADDL